MSFTLFGVIQFEYSQYLWFMIPLVLASLVITFVNFVKIPKEEMRIVWKTRVFVSFTRTLILSLLIFAVAGPFYSEETQSDGDPRIMLLLDNSTSMNLFSLDVDTLKKSLEEKIPVSEVTIASGATSKLGDGIFRQLQYGNLLLVTDGNNFKDSMNFIDLAAYAEKFNTTINAIDLAKAPTERDTAIKVTGPKSGIIDTDYYFTVQFDNLEQPVRVEVTVDGYPIYNDQTAVTTLNLKYKFSDLGYHKIVAKIDDADYFDKNNEWYKVVEIVPKPKILYVNYRPSELDSILPERYEVTSVKSIPSDISSYFAVAINDVMHDITEEQSKTLEAYTDDGNGLVVFGGMNSFKGPSQIDLMLPVKAGTTEEKNATFNFIILIDMSGVVELSMTETEHAAAALIDILKQRKELVNIGVVDFSYAGHIVYPLSSRDQGDAMKQAMNDFQDVTTIDGTLWLRPAALGTGLKIAREMLTGVQGNNNIILVSDGNIDGTRYLPKAVSEISELTKMGVRVHVYDFHSLDLDDGVLKQVRKYISSLGGGMFIDSYTSLNSLFEKALIIANYNHYITSDLLLAAVVSGENKVTVSPSGVQLVTTGTGLPIVTVNNYNKVVVITTDDGYEWAKDIVKKENQPLVYRIFDWAIGDPNRKKETYLEVGDAFIGKEAKVEYKGPTYPATSKCAFLPIEDHYECSFIPEVAGFDELLGTPYAVNYEEEYQDIGYNQAALKNLVENTNGVLFSVENQAGIISKVKSDSKVKILEKREIDWYILALAMIIFLIEIFARRKFQNKKGMS